MATRTDILVIATDAALETAVAAVIAADQTKIITRKEALRLIVRRAMRKDLVNKTRGSA